MLNPTQCVWNLWSGKCISFYGLVTWRFHYFVILIDSPKNMYAFSNIFYQRWQSHLPVQQAVWKSVLTPHWNRWKKKKRKTNIPPYRLTSKEQYPPSGIILLLEWTSIEPSWILCVVTSPWCHNTSLCNWLYWNCQRGSFFFIISVHIWPSLLMLGSL